MDQENQKPPLSPQEAGLGVGLRIGGFFFVAFFWLGYHPFLSVFLGAIAGVCAGCIVCWWQITNEPEHSHPEEKKNLAKRARYFNELHYRGKRKEQKGKSKKERAKRKEGNSLF